MKVKVPTVPTMFNVHYCSKPFSHGFFSSREYKYQDTKPECMSLEYWGCIMHNRGGIERFSARLNPCMLIVLWAGCIKSVGHQGGLATSGPCQVGGEVEERPVHCGSCVKGWNHTLDSRPSGGNTLIRAAVWSVSSDALFVALKDQKPFINWFIDLSIEEPYWTD